MRYQLAFLLTLFVATALAQKKYQFCVTSSVSEDSCYPLLKGNSEARCLRVVDSAECAIRMSRGEADFGVFSAEELLLAYQFYPNNIKPIYQLRHKDRMKEMFMYQAVAVVPSNLSPVGPGKSFKSLRNGGLCHPGFSKTQWWNDYILKYFEKKAMTSQDYLCRENVTAAENEAQNLKSFFGSACRPGDWVADEAYNTYLKKKYPELCDLCDNRHACKYLNEDNHGHMGALECLKSGRGKVAYAALSHVREYLSGNDSFQFLCDDGSVQSLTTDNPCSWIKQPWNVIAARKELSSELTAKLNKWFNQTEDWALSLKTILRKDGEPVPMTENTSLASYLAEGRKESDLSQIKSCGPPIRWCTVSELETEKCKWLAMEALALGIEPRILCEEANSTFQCLRNIANNKSDIITIDSNYGYLARKVYNLSTILYSETADDHYSVVVAVVREPENDNYAVKSFHNLKNRKACFPEYGGITWLSFVNVVRMNGIISSTSCDYAKLVSKLLSGACTPGIRDLDHSNVTTRVPSDISQVLCSACNSKRDNTSCTATRSNHYFGDKGALECLNDEQGDIAFIEARNLMNDGMIDPNRYRILCKNSSLAITPGFNFDAQCALSVTIDSEVVGRKSSSQVESLDTKLALLKLENWLGYRPDVPRPIRIYDKFDGTKDLLFKDSTSGLVPPTKNTKAILAYKDLFSHVEDCTSGVASTIANVVLVLFAFLSVLLHRMS